MAMSKKNYEAIAADFKWQVNGAENIGIIKVLRGLACDMSTTFKKDNSNFDKERFLIACGFDHMAFGIAKASEIIREVR